ncbi:hypothetical protein LOK49_LG09G00598 [Camellia lanceoleosa]|uniref:Uncharacterized protein n=1 Tax=Camellia lanceoleosa TaxID=1840588 RepID=A0ACC0GI87_9ERIC|nr:hypothetical protein LOK49_LG09G00598 [Camellia lanceoleosa]
MAAHFTSLLKMKRFATTPLLSLKLNPSLFHSTTSRNPNNPPDVAVTNPTNLRKLLSQDCNLVFNLLVDALSLMRSLPWIIQFDQLPDAADVAAIQRYSTVISLFNERCVLGSRVI